MAQTNNNYYDVPVQTLGISQNAIMLLARVGVQSVGDCVDFYERGSDALIQVPLGLLDKFDAEVIPALRQQGYIHRK